MATSYKDVLTQIDSFEEDIQTEKQKIIDKQEELKNEILQNIREARSMLVMVESEMQKKKNKKILTELEEAKTKLEDAIVTNEDILKEYC